MEKLEKLKKMGATGGPGKTGPIDKAARTLENEHATPREVSKQC